MSDRHAGNDILPAAGCLIVGAPRSGTTLTRRLLDAHPEIVSPGELNLVSACARMIYEDPVGRGMPVGVLTGLRCAGLDEAVVIERLRRLVTDVYQGLCAAEGARVWVDKDVFAAFHAREVLRLFGSTVKYVWLLRHPLDVAVSMEELIQRLGAAPHEMHAYLARFPCILDACAQIWVDVQRALSGLADAPGVDVLTVRYEDLVVDPLAQMQRLARFLGCDYPPRLLQEALSGTRGIGMGDWKTWSTSSIDSGRRNRWTSLPASTIARLVDLVSPTMTRLGYDPVDVPPDPGPRWDRFALRASLARQAQRQSAVGGEIREPRGSG